LDITQTHIKINQTEKSGKGKPKSTFQSDSPANSFEQIFAMLNPFEQNSLTNGGPKPESNTLEVNFGKPQDINSLITLIQISRNQTNDNSEGINSLKPSSAENAIQKQNVIGSTSVNQAGDFKQSIMLNALENLNLSSEDWKKADEILANLLVQVKQSTSSLPDQKAEEPKMTDGMSSMQPLFFGKTEDLAGFLQTAVGDMQLTNSNHPMTKLDHLIKTLSKEDEQNFPEILADLRAAIQTILNGSDDETITFPSKEWQWGASNVLNGPEAQWYKEQNQNPAILNNPKQMMNQLNIGTIADSSMDSQVKIHLSSDIISKAGIQVLHKDSENLGSRLQPVKEKDPVKLTDATQLLTSPIQGGNNGNESRSVQSRPFLPVSDFASEISKMAGHFVKITNGQSGNIAAKLSLYPEHLGPIEVKITTQQGQVSAQIITDTSIAKDTLQAQVQHLKEAMEQQGIVVQKIDIIQQPSVTGESNQTNSFLSQGGAYTPNEQRNFSPGSKKLKQTNQKDFEEEILPLPYGPVISKTASNIDFIV